MSAVLIINNVVWPGLSYALTSGPSQPEVGSFKPAGVSEMVDVFSGDFSYNIPLFEIGGYPINMNYSSDLSADMEASWVGLGWNLNPGVVDREMRGIPDEYMGDIIEQENNIKDNKTWMISGKINSELLGWDFPVSTSLSIVHNNFSGYSSTFNLSFPEVFGKDKRLSGGIDLGMGTGGLSISPDFSLSHKGKNAKASSLDFTFSSRQGLKDISYGLKEGRCRKIKKNKESRDYLLVYNISSGASFNPLAKPYIPDLSNTYNNNAYSFDVKLGPAASGFFPYGGVVASYSVQKISGKQKELKSYGYQHLDKYNNDEQSLLDFNRDKYAQKGRYIPDMYMSNLTYDRFHVRAQGGGGVFRMKRGDVGIISDPATIDNNQFGDDMGVSLELGFGAGFHFGGNVSVSRVKSSDGYWENSNGIDDDINFDGTGTESYEPWYFQKEGELSIEPDQEFVQDQRNDDPIKVKINTLHIAPSKFEDENGNDINLNSTNAPKRQKRAIRLDILQPTFVKDYKFCLNGTIDLYDEGLFEDPGTISNNISLENNQVVIQPQQTVARNIYPDNHITELNYTSFNGQRFIYGIPAYIKKQKEAVFSVNNIPSGNEELTGLVSYTGQENSINNESGKENFYHSQTLSDYPYAFLLTGVLSPDYSDVDGIEGPSDGDNGSYVKFSYTKISDFKWRVPYWDANHSKGLYAKTHDDKGSIIYGEKDIYYLKMIESKDDLAVFFLSERNDGRAAAGENSASGEVNQGQTQRKLDSIQVFSKRDLATNFGNAVPKKTVVFVYDYSLCQDVYNNITANGGKLTLKEVYFKYGKSGQGRQSSYTFNYSDNNPAYHPRSNDRWGNYAPEYWDTDDNGSYSSLFDNTSAEYPYVDQHLSSDPDFEYNADKYANAWLLNEISVPSGAVININYESDDYAYVQDKKAMQMIQVEGFTDLASGQTIYDLENADITTELYSNYHNSHRYLVLHYPDFNNAPYMEADGVTFDHLSCLEDLLKDEDGDLMEYMYYTFYVNLKDGNYDYVSGYLKLDPDINNHYITSEGNIYLKIKLVEIQDFINNELINPITQRSISYCKKNYADYIYEVQDPADENNGSAFLMSLVSILTGPAHDIVGRGRYMMNNNNCRQFIHSRSWVRLYNLTKAKKGGGCRVASLAMSDNWNDMTTTPGNTTNAESSSQYGQSYAYTMDVNGRQISSGVASYEPLIGGDENPFRTPVAYEERRFLAANIEDYIETPTGEAFFPSAQVGYSRVTVRPLSDENVTETAPGYQVHEFYTAKDFPTKVKKTDKTERIPLPGISILGSGVKLDYYSESEGFVVINNDMHGKQKALTELSASGSLIDKTEYYYQQNEDGTLKSSFPVFDYEDGSISEQTIGYTQDMVIDMKQSKSATTSYTVGVNTDGFFLILPAVLPSVWFSYNKEVSRYRGATVSKYIYQCGVLEETRLTHEGSVVSQKQILRDKYTAQVLLTETQNEFNDSYYSFNYPAYWYYKNMGPAFKNTGYTVSDVSINNGIANLTDAGCDMFTPGDEIIISNSGGTFKEWVIDVDPVANTITIANAAGELVNAGNADIKILRSGYRNRLSGSAGSLVCKTNPVQLIGGTRTLVFEDVLNTSATEYSDVAYMNCACQNEAGDIFNPYVEGTRGQWRPFKSYYYLDQRKQSTGNTTGNLRDAGYNTNIREDGIFTGTYCPFWKIDENGVAKNDADPDFEERWKKSNEVTMYSVRGAELENKDALDIYSGAVYGFNEMLPLIVAMNAKLRQVAYDGFEDYSVDNCRHDHFNFESADPSLSSQEFHTGRKSIKVAAQSSVELTKDL